MSDVPEREKDTGLVERNNSTLPDAEQTSFVSYAWHHYGDREPDPESPRVTRRRLREARWKKYYELEGWPPELSRRNVRRDIVEQADYWAFQALNATNQTERLSCLSECFEELSYLCEENAGDLDHWIRLLFHEVQADLIEAAKGRQAKFFASAPASNGKGENYSREEWMIQAYVTFFYKVFKKSGLSEAAAAIKVEQFLGEKNIQLNGVRIDHTHVLNIKRNFPGTTSLTKSKRVAQDHLSWLIKQIRVPVDNPRAFCEAYAELGLYKRS